MSVAVGVLHLVWWAKHRVCSAIAVGPLRTLQTVWVRVNHYSYQLGSNGISKQKALQDGGRSPGQATQPNLQLQLVMQQKTLVPQPLVYVTANGTRRQLQVRLSFMRSSPLATMLTAQA